MDIRKDSSPGARDKLMNGEINEVKEREISFSVLFKVFKKNIFIIAAATLVLAILLGAYSVVFQDTKYTAKAEFLVNNILPTAGYVTTQMTDAAATIASTCVEVSTKDILAKKAVEVHELDLYFGCPESEAVKYVMSMISAGKTDADSQIFYVNVTSLEPAHTYRVIRAVQDVMPDVVKTITTSEENSVSAPSLPLVTKVETEKDIRVLSPSPIKMIVLGAALGAVLSYVIAFIIFINDKKVYDEESITENFKQPVIGAIPQWVSESDEEAQKLSRKKLLARDVSKSLRIFKDKLIDEKTPFAITESFKQLRTNLSYSIAAERCPVFAITSDFSGSGKSTVSTNLAVSFALLGKKTLLVEGDMRCPDFKHIFSEMSGVGLSDLLSGNATSSSEVAFSTINENLFVISSGRIPPNPSELLGSNKMAKLVEEWRGTYDVVLIDLPPIHDVADASVVSSFVDGYVLIARCGHSDTSALADAIGTINKVRGLICGFVVNDVNLKVGRNGNYKYKRYSAYGTAYTKN